MANHWDEAVEWDHEQCRWHQLSHLAEPVPEAKVEPQHFVRSERLTMSKW